MKGKKLIFLLAVLVICLGAYFTVKKLNLDEADGEKKETVYLNQMEADTIMGFSFVSNGEILAFTKDGDTWRYDGNEALAMNQTAVGSMVTMLAEIEAVQVLEEHEELSEYGLDTPSNTISITTKEGKKELLIGNENKSVSGYYAMINGENTVYLISTALPNKFDCTLDNLEETSAEEETSTEMETEEQEETTAEN